MSKRRKTATEALNDHEDSDKITVNSRKTVQRDVADRRAAHFARPEFSSSDTSGLKSNNEEEELAKPKHNWPGPFSVAREIAAKAEETRKKREAEIADSNENVKGGSRYLLTDDSDQYDKILHSIFSGSKNKRKAASDASSRRTACANELIKTLKLDPAAALLLCAPGAKDLILPECSQLGEDSLVSAIMQVCENRSPFSLHALSLKNCGHAFSDKFVNALVQNVSSLQRLEVAGLYKLSDESLVKVLQKYSSTLTSLDLSCNSRLGLTGLEAITALDGLRSLVLDECIHLVDSDLLCLVREKDSADGINAKISSVAVSNKKVKVEPLFCSQLQHLERLSLAGLDHITDVGVEALLDTLGESLTSLNLSKCTQLTDASLVSIRENCHKLTHLDVSGLEKPTTAGLVGLFLSGSESGTEKVQKSVGLLETVSVRGTANTTDEAIVHLSLLAASSLRSLDMSSCHLLTNKALVAIAVNCKSIQSLDLSFCRDIEDEAVKYFVDTAPRMEKMSVWGCTLQPDSFGSVTVVGLM